MADTTASVLCQWKATMVTSTIGSGVIARKSESSTVRLIGGKATEIWGGHLETFEIFLLQKLNSYGEL